MSEEIADKENQFSDPNSVNLVFDVEQDLKIPLDTVDNRNEMLEHLNKAAIEEYGRPNLNLSKEELEQKRLLKASENLKKIDNSFQKGEIDRETRDFLYDYYINSSELYDEFKHSLNKIFGCPPQSIKYINLLEGKIDEETPYFEEHVGPDTTMVYEYEIDAPWRVENQIPGIVPSKIKIQIVVPQMKDVERAIEKVKINGKYDQERQKELAKLKPGQTIEDAGLDKAKLRTPLQKMKDILRCSILAPRYDDVVGVYNLVMQKGSAVKSSRPSKYLDNDPKNAKLFFENAKNYRDMKNYLPIGIDGGKRILPFFCEIQYKIKIQFFRADNLTHSIYEKVRRLKENFFKTQLEGDKRLINSQIYLGFLQIQSINSKTFGEYNISVLRDARILEDKLKALGYKSDKDGTFRYCRQLLDNNLLVRSSMALTDETFENSPAWLKDMFNRYPDNITKKYLVNLTKTFNKKGKYKKPSVNLTKVARNKRGR